MDVALLHGIACFDLAELGGDEIPIRLRAFIDGFQSLFAQAVGARPGSDPTAAQNHEIPEARDTFEAAVSVAGSQCSKGTGFRLLVLIM